MKPYGLNRRDTCARKMRGTSRHCPCCIPKKQHLKGKSTKVAARREGKRLTNEGGIKEP